ncbi:type II toxin-antitoxin system VapC family toxin [Elstera cyanobacteriorum]|uniref:type II toxin-antitoxin system VapC family toxin n=1 Tax=Elstera cyanobacteriorum TaxID=2022747 RepID=UPI002354901E|nr:type II toxin-antitoxin system VapC family toxin [Elstera cyanobacteriorum]MCK6441887.1 type II toxin-antitoxin system VapC family toxin [Elstera cyanobacteriorum]
MTALLLDTHVWAWTLTGSARLSASAITAIEAAPQVYVSPISFFEIAQKVRLGKWPEMVPFLDQLPGLLAVQGACAAGLPPEVCLLAGRLDWPHRDPFDRFLAATAKHLRIPLVSADTVFDGIVPRLW